MSKSPKMRLTEIDPALALSEEFGRITKGVAGHIERMRQDVIFSDGTLPARLKALAATLWAISTRCEPCLKFYIQRAAQLGATEAEIGEILAVAATMGGCVGEMWAMKAFKAYKDLAAGDSAASEATACCSTD